MLGAAGARRRRARGRTGRRADRVQQPEVGRHLLPVLAARRAYWSSSVARTRPARRQRPPPSRPGGPPTTASSVSAAIDRPRLEPRQRDLHPGTGIGDAGADIRHAVRRHQAVEADAHPAHRPRGRPRLGVSRSVTCPSPNSAVATVSPGEGHDGRYPRAARTAARAAPRAALRPQRAWATSCAGRVVSVSCGGRGRARPFGPPLRTFGMPAVHVIHQHRPVGLDRHHIAAADARQVRAGSSTTGMQQDQPVSQQQAGAFTSRFFADELTLTFR